MFPSSLKATAYSRSWLFEPGLWSNDAFNCIRLKQQENLEESPTNSRYFWFIVSRQMLTHTAWKNSIGFAIKNSRGNSGRCVWRNSSSTNIFQPKQQNHLPSILEKWETAKLGHEPKRTDIRWRVSPLLKARHCWDEKRICFLMRHEKSDISTTNQRNQQKRSLLLMGNRGHLVAALFYTGGPIGIRISQRKGQENGWSYCKISSLAGEFKIVTAQMKSNYWKLDILLNGCFFKDT